MTLNFWSSCLGFLSARILSVWYPSCFVCLYFYLFVLVYLMLRIEPRDSSMLAKHLTKWTTCTPTFAFINFQIEKLILFIFHRFISMLFKGKAWEQNERTYTISLRAVIPEMGKQKQVSLKDKGDSVSHKPTWYITWTQFTCILNMWPFTLPQSLVQQLMP